jgi:peptide/nickel transport system substrate-binding protein
MEGQNMKGTRPWRIAVYLSLSALVLGSCSTANVTTTVQTTSPATTPPKTSATVTTTVPKTTTTSDAPRYGGALRLALSGDITAFEEVYGWQPPAFTLHLTNEELLRGDWAKGPAGTGEAAWTNRGTNLLELKTGNVAESWKIPEWGTMEFKIRQGVHYALDPNSEASRLVNGREMTAQDVAFSLTQSVTQQRSYMWRTFREMSQSTTVTAPDKWTVRFTTKDRFFDAVDMLPDFVSVVPPEVVQKYGDMQNWKVSVGTGPFILADFVSGSSATLVKNSSYWGKDPVGAGKGNQLPYLDGVKYLIIPDASTREAALRTAAVDVICLVDWETGPRVVKSNPGLLSKKCASDTAVGSINMRLDKQPFSDKRVRKALMMATDFETIKKDLYGGDALIISWPITLLPEYKDAYLSLEEAPDTVKELYRYDPAKAKALLSEAGLPNGFKTEIICQNLPEMVDYFSVIKNMWSKVGVDLTINPLETGVFNTTMNARTHQQMITGSVGPTGGLYRATTLVAESAANCSFINDPWVKEQVLKMQTVALSNPPEAKRMFKDVMKYSLEQAWVVPKPVTPLYTLWWPWVKNYHGEYSNGFDNSYLFAQYAWVDQDLKRSMGH